MPDRPEPRDFAPLFELHRQANLAGTIADQVRPADTVDAGQAAHFLALAARSLMSRRASGGPVSRLRGPGLKNRL